MIQQRSKFYIVKGTNPTGPAWELRKPAGRKRTYVVKSHCSCYGPLKDYLAQLRAAEVA